MGLNGDRGDVARTPLKFFRLLVKMPVSFVLILVRLFSACLIQPHDSYQLFEKK
jgi:hypothetical protein